MLSGQIVSRSLIQVRKMFRAKSLAVTEFICKLRILLIAVIDRGKIAPVDLFDPVTDIAGMFHAAQIIHQTGVFLLFAKQSLFDRSARTKQRLDLAVGMLHMCVEHQGKPQTVLVFIQQFDVMGTKAHLICLHTDIILHVAWPHDEVDRILFQGIDHLADRAFAVLGERIIDRDRV